MSDGLCATAFHEASHVVVAKRLGLPVHSVSIKPASSEHGRPLEGGTLVRWDLLLGKREDLQLCQQAMTAAYAGIAWESMVSGRKFNEVYSECPSDSEVVAVIRNRFNERGAFPTVDDSRQVSTNASDEACAMVRSNCIEIKRFAWFLCWKGELSEEHKVDYWFGRAKLIRVGLACIGRIICQFRRSQGCTTE